MLSSLKPPLSFPSVSGAVCTFNSQYAGLPLKAHEVAIVASQSGSGTPSPSNPRTISGYSAINISATGRNIGNKDLFVRGTIGGGGQDGTSNQRLRSPFIPVKPNTSYSLMCNTEVNIYEIHKYGANGEYYGYNTINSSSTVYTFPSNTYYTRILIRYSNNAAIYVADLTQFQIAESETALPYEPFGTYTTITIGSTVYGGTYNAISGVLNVTHIKAILRGSQFVAWSGGISCLRGSIDSFVAWEKKLGGSAFRFSHGVATTRDGIDSVTNGFFCGDTTGGNQNFIFVKLSDVTTITDLASGQAYIEQQYAGGTPIEVVYELETPQEIQLSPAQILSLLGENNVWADTGDTTLQYIKLG